MEQGLFKAPQAGVNRLDYLSPSKMKLLLANPRKFFWKYAPGRGLAEKKTKALDAGKLAHCALLEPAKFSQMVVEKEFSGKGSVAAYQEWLNSLPAGVTVISNKAKEEALRIVDAVMKNPEARALLETIAGQGEVHAYAQREDGIWLHGVIDRLISGPAVVEFKTTSGSVDWDEFVWSVFEYDYHLDLATYIEIMRILDKRPVKECAWVVAQQVEPFSVRVHYPQEDEMLDLGRFDMGRAIDRWKYLTQKDPGLTNESVWFGGRQEAEEGPCKFPYHILIRRPEWQQFLTGGI